MAMFTLIEKPAPNDETPDSATHTWVEGELWRIIQRPLFNRNGTQQRGTFSVVGHVLRVFFNNDPLMAVNEHQRRVPSMARIKIVVSVIPPIGLPKSTVPSQRNRAST